MKTLLFKGKFQRHPGVNFTVREGPTWSKIVSPGNIVRLGKPSESDLPGVSYEPVLYDTRVAKITHLIQCKLKDIPEFVLDNEHNPNCRQWLGLIYRLQEVYGVHIDADTEVTCVGYRVLEEI